MNVEGWIGVAVGAGALLFAFLAWLVPRKRLRFAEEEATLRPRIDVSFRKVAFHYRPDNPGSKYVQAAIGFNIANSGRSAAHNVRCEVRLDEQHLVPDDLHGVNHDFFREYMGLKSTDAHHVNVGIRSYGPTKAHYRCVCDEVGEIEGDIEFEVPAYENQ
jgi:hypothetical protein